MFLCLSLASLTNDWSKGGTVFDCLDLPGSGSGNVSVACRRIQTSSDLQQQAPNKADVMPFKLSDIGEGIVEVVVKEWFVGVGDHVAQFDNICEVQSDKASVTITSRFDGTITHLYYDVDQVARVGEVLVDIKLDDCAEQPEQHQQHEDDTASPVQRSSSVPRIVADRQRILTTPAVRRLAAEHKVDLAEVHGTGRDGRVLKDDLLRHLGLLDTATLPNENLAAVSTTSATSTVFPSRAASVSSLDVDTPVTLTSTGCAMYSSMTNSLSVPRFDYCDEFDLSALMAVRDAANQHAPAGTFEAVSASRVTVLPFVLKACSLALQHFPVINAWLQSEQQLVYKHSHDFGVAVDSPSGLLVPCIQHVQRLSVLTLSERIQRLQQLAADGRLSPADLTTPSFTVSNIGSIGGTYASPVIVPPQVAIVAVGRSRLLPRFDAAGSVVPAHIAAFSWSADHRVVDGATLARFSNTVKAYLERPSTMLLQLK